MIVKPPNWIKYLSSDLLQKAFKSNPLRDLVRHANKRYVYWEKFKYLKMPEGFTPEQGWAYLKFTRSSNMETSPIISLKKDLFTFTITKTMYQQISRIDTNTSGLLTASVIKPTNTQKSELIISGLTEEAIASSQIEGANTSRKVAKEMLLTERKPRTKDEQMIINNYQVMLRLMDWKDLELSLEMLLDMQKNITAKTLEKSADSGRLRRNEDKIGVINKVTGETVFLPPTEKFVREQLDRLIAYANTDESEEEFIHPVIKSSILHFWLAYLHPFVDGNGRTARALFYWYMLRKNYWMFQYLSVSRIIKKSKVQYDSSFLYSEHDGNDLTYFLSYNLRAVVQSIIEFVKHYEEKLKKEEALRRITGEIGEFNERQIALLQEVNIKKDSVVDLNSYKSINRISYETSRTDIYFLVKKGLLDKIHSGKKYVFIPNTVEINKLFSTVKKSTAS